MSLKSKFLIFTIFLMLLPLGFAANHYIRDGSTGSTSGTGDCSDWTTTHACDVLPTTLVRGDTYYIADGNYAGRSFNTATSGSNLITIKKAIESDHGSATGWDLTYGDGQAVWGSVDFATSNWVFDGIIGAGSSAPSGSNPSTYGFYFTPPGSGSSIRPIQYSGNNIIIRHTAVTCPGSAGDIQQFGYSGTGNSVTVSYTYVNNCQVSHWNQGDDSVIEFSYFGNHWSSSANHGVHVEQVLRPIFRYNLVTSCPIQCIEPGGGSTTNIDNGQYYNNIFLDVSGSNGVIKGVSAGAIRNTVLYGNTIINAQGPLIYQNNEGLGVGTGNIVRNNVCYLCIGGFIYESTGNPITHSHNALFDSGSITETGVQIGSGDPFVNYAAGDYRLKVATNAGQSLPSPYNLDLYGNIRGADGIWDRGAIEFSSVPTPFDFSMSNGGTVNVVQGSNATNTITSTILSGISQSISFSASLSSGTSAIFSPTSCLPTCTTTMTIITTGSTPAGATTINVTGTNGTLLRTTNFILNVAVPDLVPPTVSITSPTGGLVSGTITLSATASDNIGVAGVQFKVDGNNVGGEDTTSPYFVSFDTTTVANGTHTISATARDAQGNTATSAPISVNVQNSDTVLIVSYGFEENSGTVTTDSSGYGRTGTLINGTSWGPGKYGRGLSFDGINDYVVGPTLTIPDTFTMMAWVNNPTNSTFESILTIGADRDLQIDGGRISFWDGIPSNYILYGALSLGWNHVAVTSDGSSLRVYINGIQSGSTLATSYAPYIGILRIGSWQNEDFLSGSIDEVMVFNKSLSQSEIQNNMNSPIVFSDTTPPIISSVVSTPSQTSSTLFWNTNELATSRVDYGLTTSYGSFVTNSTSSMIPSVRITGLNSSTQYFYRITSTDSASNQAIQTGNFTTTGISGIIVQGRITKSTGSCVSCIINITINGASGSSTTSASGTFTTVISTTLSPGNYFMDILITDDVTVKNFMKRVVVL